MYVHIYVHVYIYTIHYNIYTLSIHCLMNTYVFVTWLLWIMLQRLRQWCSYLFDILITVLCIYLFFWWINIWIQLFSFWFFWATNWQKAKTWKLLNFTINHMRTTKVHFISTFFFPLTTKFGQKQTNKQNLPQERLFLSLVAILKLLCVPEIKLSRGLLPNIYWVPNQLSCFFFRFQLSWMNLETGLKNEHIW